MLGDEDDNNETHFNMTYYEENYDIGREMYVNLPRHARANFFITTRGIRDRNMTIMNVIDTYFGADDTARDSWYDEDTDTDKDDCDDLDAKYWKIWKKTLEGFNIRDRYKHSYLITDDGNDGEPQLIEKKFVHHYLTLHQLLKEAETDFVNVFNPAYILK